MITPDHFLNRPYRIPDLEERSEDFQNFVDFHEKDVLKKLLGTVFYDALVAGLAAGSPDAKWTDLKNGGVTYEYAGCTYKYDGLIELLKPIIYALWLRDIHDKITGSGVVRNIKDKTEYINPGRRITLAQNEFAKRVGDECNHEDTLYGYIYSRYTDYVDDFNDWRFTAPGYENVFGI